MKVGETWELKSSVPKYSNDANYHQLVKISEVGSDFVSFTDTAGEIVMSYYNGLPRKIFLEAYSKVYK